MSQRNPYELDPQAILEPPRRLLEQLRYCGPGFILSACIVGSGELIATTTLGAKAGFATLWVILLSCLVKVAMQLQFARHAIQHGETALTAINRLPGLRFGPANWAIWFWALMFPVRVLQVGGIVGGLGLLMNLIVPSVPVAAWCLAAAVAAALLVSAERYQLIERASLAMTVLFTTLTFTSVVALQWTDYAFTASDVLGGLQGQLPADAVFFVIAAFGLTGVGGDEILYYTYWLLEKGYAARVGPYRPDDPDWQRRARGWTRIMTLDAIVSMVSYTAVTCAFYILGAAVLHARGELPEGTAMVETLARMYTESLGPWAEDVFLAGAFVVLFSTTFSALASWTRIYSDTLGQLGFLEFEDPQQRLRSIRIMAWGFPLLWAVVFLFVKQPMYMIMLGGLATAAVLLLVVYAAICFRYGRTAPELKPSWAYDAAFWASAVAIAAFAASGIAKAIGSG
ncbi:MAG: iron transporter [Planctomycetaceae bacterium]|nr:iron transporter [Planctomycetaceae bacterium]